MMSASWQVVAVCVVVACVATVNAYPEYYGHGGHDYISAGVEDDTHVSITVGTVKEKTPFCEGTSSKVLSTRDQYIC